MKLQQLHAADDLKDLSIPASNQLELLQCDRKGDYSIRIKSSGASASPGSVATPWMSKSRTITKAEYPIMAAKKIKLTHPGKILREEFMEPVGITAYALAKSLHVPLPRVNDIVREKRAISPEMAVLLSRYFGTSDSYWINLQGHYDLEIAKDRVARQVARIQPHPHDQNGTLQVV